MLIAFRSLGAENLARLSGAGLKLRIHSARRQLDFTASRKKKFFWRISNTLNSCSYKSMTRNSNTGGLMRTLFIELLAQNISSRPSLFGMHTPLSAPTGRRTLTHRKTYSHDVEPALVQVVHNVLAGSHLHGPSFQLRHKIAPTHHVKPLIDSQEWVKDALLKLDRDSARSSGTIQFNTLISLIPTC
jgi:hypothetical protein